MLLDGGRSNIEKDRELIFAFSIPVSWWELTNVKPATS